MHAVCHLISKLHYRFIDPPLIDRGRVVADKHVQDYRSSPDLMFIYKQKPKAGSQENWSHQRAVCRRRRS